MNDLNERNTRILKDREEKLNKVTGPRVGDYVRFADKVTRRISYVWDWGVPNEISMQTSTCGSFYLGYDYISFSGSLYNSIPRSTLTITDEKRDGSIWFFRDDWAQAGNGIEASIEFRVYTSTANAPT